MARDKDSEGGGERGAPRPGEWARAAEHQLFERVLRGEPGASVSPGQQERYRQWLEEKARLGLQQQGGAPIGRPTEQQDNRAPQSEDEPEYFSTGKFRTVGRGLNARQVRESLIVRRSDRIKMKATKWFWPGRMARGRITIVAGPPGVSKSIVTMGMAAAASVGAVTPDGRGSFPAGNIILLTSEDDYEDSVVPRFIAGGGGKKGYVLRIVEGIRIDSGRDSNRRTFSMQQDIPNVEAALQQTSDTVLFIVDTWSAYLGSHGTTDTFRAADVRSALEPVQDLARRYDLTIILVTHLTKNSAIQGLMRVLDSVGLTAAARSVFLVHDDPEDRRPERDKRSKLLLPMKGNVRGFVWTGLRYNIVDMPTGNADVPEAGTPAWQPEEIQMTAEDVMEAERHAADKRSNDNVQRAMDMIRAMMDEGGGCVKAEEATEKLRAAGITKSTIRTAKEHVGIITRPQSGGRNSSWCLPTDELPF